ncbi:hypothetical protein M8494_29230 [Serratia ureilytica]
MLLAAGGAGAQFHLDKRAAAKDPRRSAPPATTSPIPSSRKTAAMKASTSIWREFGQEPGCQSEVGENQLEKP